MYAKSLCWTCAIAGQCIFYSDEEYNCMDYEPENTAVHLTPFTAKPIEPGEPIPMPNVREIE
jgi:hypothetical protein